MKSNDIIIIPDGESGFALSVLTGLSKTEGIEIYLFSNVKFPNVRFSRYCKNFCFVENEGFLLNHIIAISRERGDGRIILFPLQEKGTLFVYKHKEKLDQLKIFTSLPIIDSFYIASDKLLFAKFSKQNNLPHPYTIPVDKNIANSNISFPVLIKPTQGSNGQGIMFFNTKMNLLEFIASEGIINKRYIAQQYIKGFDIDCSVLCKDGKILAYTIQQGITKKSEFMPSSTIKFLFDQETLKVVSELMHKLNWNGVAHIDLRYDEENGEIKVIEINPRFWASLLGSLSVGVNFPQLLYLSIVNVPFTEPKYKFNCYVDSLSFLKCSFKKIKERNNIEGKVKTSLFYIIIDPLPFVFSKSKTVYRCLKSILKKDIADLQMEPGQKVKQKS